jgi:hypothetical protein
MMGKLTEKTSENDFNRGSWAVLLLALAYIASSVFAVSRIYQQPSDGWWFDNSEEVYTAVAPLTDTPSPLLPGDQLLEVAGTAIVAEGFSLRPIVPPPNWQVGQTINYMVLRDKQRVELEVPLVKRPFSAYLRYYQLSGNIWLTQLLWYLIGFVVFFLRPRDTAARLLLLFTTYWNTITVVLLSANDWHSFWLPPRLFYSAMPLGFLWAFMFAMMLHLVLAFPVRKWPLTRRPRLFLTILYGLPTISLALTLISGNSAFYEAVLLPMIGTLAIALVAATVHNLRHVHDPVVRAQIGWVALGIAMPILGAFGGERLFSLVFPGVDNTSAFRNLLFSILGLFLPLCFGIAITRYRLFDIHLIIRKTVQYGVVTAVLALIYFGTIILLQSLVGQATGEQSPIIIVLSTLLIAALFNPLRRRVQDAVDRRFFRKKYNAQQVLAQFAQTTQKQTYMEALQAELLRVVQETMKPDTVTIRIKR